MPGGESDASRRLRKTREHGGPELVCTGCRRDYRGRRVIGDLEDTQQQILGLQFVVVTFASDGDRSLQCLARLGGKPGAHAAATRTATPPTGLERPLRTETRSTRTESTRTKSARHNAAGTPGTESLWVESFWAESFWAESPSASTPTVSTAVSMPMSTTTPARTAVAAVTSAAPLRARCPAFGEIVAKAVTDCLTHLVEVDPDGAQCFSVLFVAIGSALLGSASIVGVVFVVVGAGRVARHHQVQSRIAEHTEQRRTRVAEHPKDQVVVADPGMLQVGSFLRGKSQQHLVVSSKSTKHDVLLICSSDPSSGLTL